VSLHYRLTFILGIVELVTWALIFYVPAVATRAVADTFGVSTAAVLGGFSLAMLATGLASPAVCRRIDRFGGRTVMLAGLITEAAGLLIMATAPGLPMWYLGWAVAGLGMAGGLYDAAMATAGRMLGAAARPTITGLTMIAGFASSVGWPLGVAMVGSLGWRGALLAYAGLLVAINLPLLLALPRTVPPPAPAPRPTPGQVAQSGAGLFLCIGAFFTLRSVVSTVMSVNGLDILVGLGIPQSACIGLLALIGPAQVGMRVIQAVIGRRWNPVVVSWIGAALVPMATFGLALAAGGPFLITAAAVFALGYGASNGILTIARGVLPLHLFGPAGYATRIGQLALPVVLAQAATPLLAAPLIGAWSADSVFMALGAVSLAAALFLVPLAFRRR
jgi:MFS family permease